MQTQRILHTNISLCASVCVCMRVLCLCVIHMMYTEKTEVNGGQFFLRRTPSNLEFTSSVRVTDQQAPVIHLSPPITTRITGIVCYIWLLMWVLEI